MRKAAIVLPVLVLLAIAIVVWWPGSTVPS